MSCECESINVQFNAARSSHSAGKECGGAPRKPPRLAGDCCTAGSTPKPLHANVSQRFYSTPWLDSPQRPSSRSRLSNQLEDTWFDMEPKNLFQAFEELAAGSSPDL
ncbi:membrane-associated tyrosine and threonine-specific cdc2-inhibitory kinase [Ixodes scapularis]